MKKMTKIHNNAASRFVAAPSLILTGTQALLLPVILSTLIVTVSLSIQENTNITRKHKCVKTFPESLF